MAEPRYALIARILAEGIAEGRYPAGSLLPSEAALSKRFEASRHTIREALGELAQSGLVSRRNGVGTLVEARDMAGGFDASLASLEDLTQFAATHRRVIRAVNEVVADRDLARAVGVKPGTRWLHIASVRVSSEKGQPPVCWTDNYVPAHYAALRELLEDNPSALISDVIETRFGRRSVEVRQTIEAAALPEAAARELDATPGGPALRIVRRYLDRAGEAVSTTISLHPAGRFVFSMTLRRAAR